MKILVATMVINDWYLDIVKYGIKNLKMYCNKHNYDLIIDYGKGEDTIYDGERDVPWYKILLVKKLLIEKDFDYLIWLDADTMIYNHEIKFEYFIEKYLQNNTQKELLITNDRTTLNTGIMFFKKSDFFINLMDQIWNNTNDFDKSFHEQTSFENLYLNDNKIQDKVLILPYGVKDELIVYWAQFNVNNSFIIHCARCIHDIIGFYRMMDYYYPFQMDEENEEEYMERINYLKYEYDKEIKMIINNIPLKMKYFKRVKNIFKI